MSEDYRMSIISNTEAALSEMFTPDHVAVVSSILVKQLANYDIQKRCTELAPPDDGNYQLIKRYIACLSVDGKSERTLRHYHSRLLCFSSYIRKPFTEVGVYDIRLYLACEKERGVSNRSVNCYRAVLSSFYQWMLCEGFINKNPMALIKPIKYAKEIKKPFSDVEIDAIRSACHTLKERAIIEMLVTTGVRVSELCGMNVADVDAHTLSVHVVNGKGSKERVTYTTAVGLKHLQRYLADRSEEGSAELTSLKVTITK